MDPLAEEFPAWSPYNFTMNNPIRLIDPDGRAPLDIIGATKSDANKFKDDVHNVLSDAKFTNLRGLIDVKGKKFNKIDAGDLSNALNGVTLTADEQAYVDVVVNTINSSEQHVVEYLNSSDNASSNGATAVKEHLNSAVGKGIGDGMLTPEGNLKGGTISVLGGEGFNVPTKKGSHSFLIEDKISTANDRSVTSGHEVFGHGIPSARKMSNTANNTNAIRTDNLIRRIFGMPERNGSNHAGGVVTDYSKLPITK